jgi:PIN domain nuclease of toxin-antitoxin system
MVATLPAFDDHRDPFDRLLVAQSQTEPLTLLTADATLARYGPTVRVV